MCVTRHNNNNNFIAGGLLFSSELKGSYFKSIALKLSINFNFYWKAVIRYSEGDLLLTVQSAKHMIRANCCKKPFISWKDVAGKAKRNR